MFKLDEVGSDAIADFARTARNLNSLKPTVVKQNADGKQNKQMKSPLVKAKCRGKSRKMMV